MKVYIGDSYRGDMGELCLVGEASHGYSTYAWTYSLGELRIAGDDLPEAFLRHVYETIGDYMEENT